jgi:predicted nuclease of predicted toxin-antitoxin system
VRLLLDENLPPLVGDALKAAGHDVLMASSACPGAPDEDVIALAVAEGRVLVTQDKDFGQLAFQRGQRPRGLVRVALPRQRPAEKAATLVQALANEDADGVVLTVGPARVRRSALP